eukprot:TRINITY_DN7767_c0_g1_i1.p1 TRINITY_DN7767_c0_g1~~TRINITY_DN7767_c0_g1_i1.p1  ORF type:complete len:136 (-),score=6.84 TRINITY_DN7767_c0_g1_i1:55-462(-)
MVPTPTTIELRFLQFGESDEAASDFARRLEAIADNAFWNSRAVAYEPFAKRVDFLQSHISGEWQADSWNTLRGCVLPLDDLNQYIRLMASHGLPVATRLRCIYSLLSHCFEHELRFESCSQLLDSICYLQGFEFF